MAVVVLSLIVLVCAFIAAVLLDRNSARSDARRSDERLVDRLDALLPQTQCGQCTFAGCRPYAEAMAGGRADSNQCPPGGNDTAARLARVLGRLPKRVGSEFGDVDAPVTVAFINEELCIGCALCLPACPVDAIVGAARFTHTVIATDCTGCKLCLAPCPVDCIEMRPAAFSGVAS